MFYFTCTFLETPLIKNSTRVAVVPWCIDSVTSSVAKTKSWPDTLASLNHSAVDLLFLDMEGSEWKLLPELFLLPESTLPHQIAAEFHIIHEGEDWFGTLANFLLQVNKKGYSIIGKELNPYHPECCCKLYLLADSMAPNQKNQLSIADGASASVTIYAQQIGYLTLPYHRDCPLPNNKTLSCTFMLLRDFGPEPDNVIFTADFQFDAPMRSSPHQKFVILSMEPAWLVPHWYNATYMSYFNVTASFRKSSDIQVTYAQELSHIPLESIVPSRLLVFINSNCNPPSQRDNYVQELMKYIPVDSFGKCLHYKEIAEEFPECVVGNPHGDKRCVIAHYKYTLSFENCFEEDYVTEKFYDALQVGSIPIVRGAPNIGQYAPHPTSFIDANKLTPRELANLILSIEKNAVGFMEYHKWRINGPSATYAEAVSRNSVYCQLCTHLYAHKKEKTIAGTELL